MLVAFPGVPLWLFNVFSSLVFELLMPFFGVVMAYVYGDHVERHEERSGASSPVEAGLTGPAGC